MTDEPESGRTRRSIFWEANRHLKPTAQEVLARLRENEERRLIDEWQKPPETPDQYVAHLRRRNAKHDWTPK